MYLIQFRMATDIKFVKGKICTVLVLTYWFGFTKLKQNQKNGNYSFVLIAHYIGKLKECK